MNLEVLAILICGNHFVQNIFKIHLSKVNSFEMLNLEFHYKYDGIIL